MRSVEEEEHEDNEWDEGIVKMEGEREKERERLIERLSKSLNEG